MDNQPNTAMPTPCRHKIRLIATLAILLCHISSAQGKTNAPVIADSLTHKPLANVYIFNDKGKFIGASRANGHIDGFTEHVRSITIRCMGFKEKAVAYPYPDTIFMSENITELPEVVFESRQEKMLHILAYVREYSTLSTYTDTITLFREKMVDFMLPNENNTRYKGWRYPRVINSRSYYQFTNASGLDSVSDRCNQHFTWSDWIAIPPASKIPPALNGIDNGTDTVAGKYTPAEIWVKNGDKISLDVNVMADTSGRRWTPDISMFFNNPNVDFEQFRLRVNYSDVVDNYISPADLTSYAFNIESRGRGRGMFRFNRRDEPFFVTTYAEIYILDKEYITIKEAKKWDNRKFNSKELEIYEPMEAPDLQPSILALINRVNNINSEKIRLAQKPDHRLAGRNVSKQNFGIGHRALSLLKQLTGITYYKSHKNFNRRWDEFKDDRKQKNKRRNHTEP